ncbi:MAG: DUF1080 domain-containing protein [Planctomycetales bacterium]|nr:DUF1080 domain-containing protein [Planctomycetales bacterium]
MCKPLLPAIFVLLFTACSFALADEQGDDGFEPLFNGKDFSGWVKEGQAGFVVRDGMLICDGSGNWPTWLRTSETFENFVLRLEYKTRFGAESGVFFHAPLHGRISHVGFEVQIGGPGGLRRHSTGAIFDAVAPLKNASRDYRDEEFDELEITMNWPQLKVKINGQVVQDLNVEEHESLRYRPRLGYIGFQDRGKPVLFRNIRIKRLPDQVRDEWQPLLNGNDLQGWKISEQCSATWSIENGELLGKDGHGYLISDSEYRNCEFQTYVRSSPLANGGVFFRWVTGKGRGFEIQIEDIPDSNDPTGSIYGRVRAERLPFQPGEWVLMQVFLQEKHCVVRINGETVAESHEMGGARIGNISLQMHTGHGWVRWKDMRVRVLAAGMDQPKHE